MTAYIPKYIIVHHSAAASPVVQFEAINEWHRARGFPLSNLGYFVGYHCVIEKDGTLRRARLDTERDCDSLGHNFDSLSVCLAGNFSVGEPTPEQIHTLGELLAGWSKEWTIPLEQIFPHRHFNGTECYGTHLSDDWAREVARLYMATQPPLPPLPCTCNP